jgi:hypothetical protein
LDEIVQENERKQFEKYFRNNVHIIHYQVPKDIDLNHYFEIMNSRGEQLEKHEIVKANLMEKLDDDKERAAFNDIWECCSQMSVYVQQNLNDNRSAEKVFGNSLCEFRHDKFDDIVALLQHENNDSERRSFFEKLGCGDFGLKVFDQFYFSRTRRSLEHYYPQALAGDDKELNKNEINCFGNYAMIGSAANSMGSDWPPKEKIGYYLESPNKIDQISVASLKFRVMMQICSESQKWEFEQIKKHQEKMVNILVGK